MFFSCTYVYMKSLLVLSRMVFLAFYDVSPTPASLFYEYLRHPTYVYIDIPCHCIPLYCHIFYTYVQMHTYRWIYVDGDIRTHKHTHTQTHTYKHIYILCMYVHTISSFIFFFLVCSCSFFSSDDNTLLAAYKYIHSQCN